MKRGIVILVSLIVVLYVKGQPPIPQMQEMQELGRQNPYISTVWLVFTNVVTNVITTTYSVKHARYIERTSTNGLMETNYSLMNPSRTNILSVVTNLP